MWRRYLKILKKKTSLYFFHLRFPVQLKFTGSWTVAVLAFLHRCLGLTFLSFKISEDWAAGQVTTVSFVGIKQKCWSWFNLLARLRGLTSVCVCVKLWCKIRKRNAIGIFLFPVHMAHAYILKRAEHEARSLQFLPGFYSTTPHHHHQRLLLAHSCIWPCLRLRGTLWFQGIRCRLGKWRQLQSIWVLSLPLSYNHCRPADGPNQRWWHFLCNSSYW